MKNDVQEKFDNSAVGKKVNQATAAVQKAHSQVQSKYEKSLDALREKRKDISHYLHNETKLGRLAQQNKKFINGDEEYRKQLEADLSVDMDNLSDKDYRKAYGFNKAVDRKVNKFIQASNEIRDSINQPLSNFRKSIDRVRKNANGAVNNVKWLKRSYKNQTALKLAQSITKSKKGQDIIYTGLSHTFETAKWAGRMIAKTPHSVILATANAAVAVADGAHRVVNGAIGLTTNIAASTVGSVAKAAVGTSRIVSAPIAVAEAVAKTPSVIAEGALRAANVTKNAGHVKKAVKSTVNFTGEVLSQTGDQMGRNKRK